MASFRALLPAGHGVPVAALKAAATSGASFAVVCPAGGRAKAVVAALRAATKGAGHVLSTRAVACGTGGEDVGEVANDDPKAVFFVGDGEDRTGEEVANDDPKAVFFVGDGEDRTGEEVSSDGVKAKDIVFFGAAEDRTGKEFSSDGAKGKDIVFFGAAEDRTGKEFSSDGAKTKDIVIVGAGEDRTGKATKDSAIFGSGEMTMEELLVMFHKDTAMILRQATNFNNQPMLGRLIASCDAIGEQIKKAKVLDSSEGRSVVHSLIALHLRIVSCAGRVVVYKPGSSQPEMWVGNRYRLPCKEKLAGTLMELLLYSMMLASAAMDPFIGTVEWDFTSDD